ncbi:hypothetical protein AOG23_23545 [Rhizobium acidisoli]|nr:hypothetical protein AOG23_23545 [Rhizobium acidisoli]
MSSVGGIAFVPDEPGLHSARMRFGKHRDQIGVRLGVGGLPQGPLASESFENFCWSLSTEGR